MSLEDIEMDNVNRTMRVLKDKHGKLTTQLSKSFDIISLNLMMYEVDHNLLDRINNAMYNAINSDSLVQVEKDVKYLADTFWHQV